MSLITSLTQIDYFPVNGKNHSVTWVQFDSDLVSESWDDYRIIKASELYGVLRSRDVLAIHCHEYGGYVLMEITYWDQNWQEGIGPDYFKVSREQMDQFLQFFCNRDIETWNEKPNWLEDGF